MGKNKTESIRANLTIPKYLKDWLMEQADNMSISMTSYIIMALNTFKEERENMNNINDMNRLLRELKALVEEKESR